MLSDQKSIIPIFIKHLLNSATLYLKFRQNFPNFLLTQKLKLIGLLSGEYKSKSINKVRERRT